MIMTPWEDLFFVINNLLLGEEPVRSNIRNLKELFISKTCGRLWYTQTVCHFFAV